MLDGPEEQEAEADGVAEADDGLGVEGGVDGAGGLGLGDEVGEAVAAQVEGALHEAADLGVAPGGDEGLEQQRAVLGPIWSVTRCDPTVVRMSVTLPSKRCSLKSWSSSLSERASMAASSSSALPVKRP